MWASFLGMKGSPSPIPYFDGEGPERAGCKHCGACMVGCRYNAKNTLPKNYLYFAEKNGAQVIAGSEVVDIRPISGRCSPGMIQPGIPGYEVTYRSSTRFFKGTSPHCPGPERDPFRRCDGHPQSAAELARCDPLPARFVASPR